MGEDLTPAHGIVESLKIRPGGGGPAVVLVTSGNNTFETEGPRHALLEAVRAIESGVSKPSR